MTEVFIGMTIILFAIMAFLFLLYALWYCIVNDEDREDAEDFWEGGKK